MTAGGCFPARLERLNEYECPRGSLPSIQIICSTKLDTATDMEHNLSSAKPESSSICFGIILTISSRF